MKASMSVSFMLKEATSEPPASMISMAASTGDSFLSRAIVARVLPTMVLSREAVIKQRIGSTAPGEVLVHFVMRRGTKAVVIQVLEQGSISAGLGPARDESRGNTRSRCRVWVLACRYLEACFACVVDQRR